ncbi:unnamed protein product, partial [Owenia fusiformis]
NYRQYNLSWKEGGVNPDQHPEHSKYIDEFCSSFYTDVTKLICNAREKIEQQKRSTNYNTDYDEIVHHLNFVNEKTEMFCGQKDFLDKVKDFLDKSSNRVPLVIYAESGVGKTSVMAQICKDLQKWFKKEQCVRIIKFLGTSAKSNNLFDVLLGVCQQLADTYDIIMEPTGS